MKTTLLSALLALALLSNATGNFNLIEINPLQGHQTFAFSDSNRSVYGAGSIASITQFKSNLYFIAQDSYDNEELWTSDGTQAGTYLVKDINPNGSSQIGRIVPLGNRMLFMASDNNNWDFDLFASDGTETGTEKIAELNSGWNDLLNDAGILGDKIIFSNGNNLLMTDGTTGGMDTILTLQSLGYMGQQPSNFVEVKGKIYFTMNGPQGRPEMWETDGTPVNTRRIVDFSTDTNNIWSVSQLLAFDDKLFMTAQGNNSGLFVVNNDGSLTRMVFPGNNSYIYSPHVENGQLFFTAYNANSSNMYLYHMSSATSVAEIVPSLQTVPVGAGRGLSYCNGSIYFVGDNPQQIHSLNLSSLSHGQIDLPDYSMVNYNSAGPFLVGDNGKIFFAAEEVATGNQVLMESNGTTEGTVTITPGGANTNIPFNTIVGCGTQSVFDFKMFGNKVVVPANFNDAGRELWFYEPEVTTTGVIVVPNEFNVALFPNPVASQLNIRVNERADETLVRVTDIKGAVVTEKVLKGELATLDVSDLANGNYCINFIAADKVFATRKFTITR